MLIYSFICSIVFTIVIITFIIATFISFKNAKKIDSQTQDLINGFKVYDFEGGVDDKK